MMTLAVFYQLCLIVELKGNPLFLAVRKNTVGKKKKYCWKNGQMILGNYTEKTYDYSCSNNARSVITSKKNSIVAFSFFR